VKQKKIQFASLCFLVFCSRNYISMHSCKMSLYAQPISYRLRFVLHLYLCGLSKEKRFFNERNLYYTQKHFAVNTLSKLYNIPIFKCFLGFGK